MSNPKLHHYVPQFYLRRFADSAGRLWVWDRDRDRIFSTGPGSVAAESNFYLMPELAEAGYDPLTMEKQFADLEGNVAAITSQWLGWVREGEQGDRLTVPDINREVMSLFLTLQFLRTSDTRSILAAFSATDELYTGSDEAKRALHMTLLWDNDLIAAFVDRIAGCTWMFVQNRTGTPFLTSDNPVAFRGNNNRMWLKTGVLGKEAYLVYPLAPDVIMYCYPDEGKWHDARISRFDCQISPVTLTDKMIRNDNTAQVFTASRFVISSKPKFDSEREFSRTLGTDTNAPPGVSFFE